MSSRPFEGILPSPSLSTRIVDRYSYEEETASAQGIRDRQRFEVAVRVPQTVTVVASAPKPPR